MIGTVPRPYFDRVSTIAIHTLDLLDGLTAAVVVGLPLTDERAAGILTAIASLKEELAVLAAEASGTGTRH